MTQLIVASLLFVGTHFLMSHPLRAPLVRAMGQNGFRGLYSLVALATFGWMIWALTRIGGETIAEPPGDTAWMVATFVMWFASILLAGSFFSNPAFPAPEAIARRDAAKAPRGVFAITRHPMMWAIALWALVHMALWPTPSNHVFDSALLVLALGGAWGQDHKKRAQLGEAWAQWSARTSYLPFAALVSGRARWSEMLRGLGIAFVAGTIFFFAISWAHPMWGAPRAGFWKFIG